MLRITTFAGSTLRSVLLSHDFMSIESAADLAGMQQVGRVVALIIQEMTAAARIGITTAELDAVAASTFTRSGARSAPQLTYGFPGVTCISVNDEIVHGIPGPRRLEPGDVLKVDVTFSTTSPINPDDPWEPSWRQAEPASLTLSGRCGFTTTGRRGGAEPERRWRSPRPARW
jgi:methionine aminopeptidase